MVLSILATIVMGGVAAVAKGLTRDWLHPATVFTVLWACACGLPVLIAPGIITSGSGALWILLNAVIVTVGGVGGTAFANRGRRRFARMTPTRPRPQALSHSALRVLAVACLLLGVLYVFLWLQMQGFVVAQVGDVDDVGRIARDMSVQRYSTMGQATTLLVQVLLSVFYLAPLLGGTLFVRRRNALDTSVALLCMVPSLAAFALQSTRSSVLFGGTMWATGYMTTRVYYGLKSRRVRVFALGLGVLAVPLLLVLIAAGDALRLGAVPTATDLGGAMLTDRVKTYMCGHVAALSIWLDDTKLSDLQPALGRYTLAGLYELIRPGSRVSGIVEGVVDLPTGSTNVYTVFRGVIEDTTLPGSLVVMLVLSFCGGIAYCRVLEGKERWICVLAASYAGTLVALTSIFNYNSILLALALYSVMWAPPWRRWRTAAWGR